MKLRHSEKGMALVITLMMLAIVTFMAVVFLAMSRRERTSVKISEEQQNTRQMADMALARAQSEITSHMTDAAERYLQSLATINTNYLTIAIGNSTVQRAKLHFDLLSSKNYIRPGGFVPGDTSPANVNYADKNGNLLALNSDNYLQNIANLQYDPRAPVYVGNEFRYYIDFNRNGFFETNGDVLISDPAGHFYNADGSFSKSNGGIVTRMTGDPEWIGVLERPDLPHSESNRFVGRFGYIILPTGRTLDQNFIHNMSSYAPSKKDFAYEQNISTNRYTRNQGVGPWEINMAAFLMDFSTNIFPNTTVNYDYGINRASGVSFKAAAGLLAYRYGFSRTNLLTPFLSLTNSSPTGPPPEGLRWGRANDVFGTGSDYVDYQGDGPYIQYDAWVTNSAPLRTGQLYDNDDKDRYWFATERMAYTAEFSDVQRYFNLASYALTNTDLSTFNNRFTNAVTSSRNNSYDRYAYYRWLAQIGADSAPALAGKIHLNFLNEPGSLSTNLHSWANSGDNGGRFAGPETLNRQPLLTQNTNKVWQSSSNRLTNFFLITADAMLRASMVTNIFLELSNNLPIYRTNYTIGGSYFVNPDVMNISPRAQRQIANLPVRHDLSITNIQIYYEPAAGELVTWRHRYVTNQEYTPALHRLLQLTANIYDNMTNRGPVNPSNPEQEPYYPTVFRPVLAKTPTNILIVNWVADNTTDFALRTNQYNVTPGAVPVLRQQWWYTKEEAFRKNVNITNINIWGQPWVIGVKKGWPNFNEYSIETFIQVTRKLEIAKLTPGEIVSTNLSDLAERTKQIFVLGISNTFGVEAWNSFAKAVKKGLQVSTEIQSQVGIERIYSTNVNAAGTNLYPLQPIANVFLGDMRVITNWAGRKATRTPLAVSTNVNGLGNVNSDFRVPLYTTWSVLPDSDFVPGGRSFSTPGKFYPGPFNERHPVGDIFQPLDEIPHLRLVITNRIRYALMDIREGHVIDFVTLDNVITRVDLKDLMGGPTNTAFAAGFNPGLLWDTTVIDPRYVGTANTNFGGLTRGILEQLLVSRGDIRVSKADWAQYSPTSPLTNEMSVFLQFMSMDTDNENLKHKLAYQAPFSPTRRFYLQTMFQANDPLVHYMYQDLRDPYQQNKPQPIVPGGALRNDELGLTNDRRWKIRKDARFYNDAYQDPGVGTSDDWQFPIAKLDNNQRVGSVYGIPHFNYRFPNIGTLGQIHRGTPWQTVYLKSDMALNTPPDQTPLGISPWAEWSGSYGTHPTNDWKLVGLFTTAMTENAARGLLSVNQTNMAAWSAVLSGVQVITNSVDDEVLRNDPLTQPRFGIPQASASSPRPDMMIQPQSIQLSNIVRGINAYRATRPLGVFANLGEILGTPELSSHSPFLHLSQFQHQGMFTDEAIEAIPQRILSLLKDDEPRFTVYCFGQTLKPAPRSFATSSQFYNLCVNYQVTGEYATKAVFHVEGELNNPNNPLRTVIESFEPLPPYE